MFTSELYLLSKNAVALDIASIGGLFYTGLSGRIATKSKQSLFVKRTEFFSWSLDLGTQGPSVPTSPHEGHVGT